MLLEEVLKWTRDKCWYGDLTVSSVDDEQMISAESTGFCTGQVHRFGNILLIRVTGWGKERRS